jgi:hypothetical protein
VLELAASACPEDRASRFRALGVGLDYTPRLREREVTFALNELGLDNFAGQRSGNENYTVRRTRYASSVAGNFLYGQFQSVKNLSQFYNFLVV